MTRRGRKLGEDGSSLLELAAALPVLVLLLCVLGYAFLWSMSRFRYELADWIMQEEVRGAMERVVEDARTSRQVIIETGRTGFSRIKLIKRAKTEGGPVPFDIYSAEQPGGLIRKICKSSTSYPLTGDSIFTNMTIVRFHGEWKEPATLRIEMGGKSLVSRHQFHLQRDIFLPEAMRDAEG